ncbi:MAG: nuclear transport factor 2 family protein [Sulfurifustaceae bacterium]
MNAVQNKEILQDIFSALSKGNGRPFVESMAEDFCWTITGTTPWSKTYRGKEAVLSQLLRPLLAQFAGQYTNTAQRFIAEDDYVVVECRGRVATKAGKPYNNTYCYVIRLADGKMRELTEYLDTALVEAVLQDPGTVVA